MITWFFDPGQTTGYAKYQEVTLCDWGEFELWRGLDSRILPGDMVIYESFFLGGPSFRLVGIEVIGVIKYLCETLNIEPKSQSPSSIVGVFKWPIYDFSSVKGQHAKDAIAHGIVYFGSPVQLPKEFYTSEH